MKRHTSRGVLAAVLAVIAGAVGQAEAGNILINPGFETGSLSPWFPNSATPVAMVTNSDAHTGVYSVSAFAANEIIQNFAPVPTVDITEVSFWAKRPGGAFDTYEFFYSDNSAEIFFPIQGTSSDWTFFNVTKDLNPSKSLSGFGVFGTSGINGVGGVDTGLPALLDDFTVNVVSSFVVPEPSTIVACGLGTMLAAGALVRHRRSRNPV